MNGGGRWDGGRIPVPSFPSQYICNAPKDNKYIGRHSHRDTLPAAGSANPHPATFCPPGPTAGASRPFQFHARLFLKKHGSVTGQLAEVRRRGRPGTKGQAGVLFRSLRAWFSHGWKGRGFSHVAALRGTVAPALFSSLLPTPEVSWAGGDHSCIKSGGSPSSGTPKVPAA